MIIQLQIVHSFLFNIRYLAVVSHLSQRMTISFQEVESDAYNNAFRKLLEPYGYWSVYDRKNIPRGYVSPGEEGAILDGCAIFFNSQK